MREAEFITCYIRAVYSATIGGTTEPLTRGACEIQRMSSSPTGNIFHPASRESNMWQEQERQYVETARIGRLATADAEGRPHVVPVCFALVDDHIVIPIDEKPQRVSPDELRRSRDISENPRVALLVDHYTEDWSHLGWVQVRGTATRCVPGEDPHAPGIAALRRKYYQYADHDLENRPLIRITLGSVRSWGTLKRTNHSRGSL